MSVRFFTKVTLQLVGTLLATSPCFATKCMEPSTIEDLKKAHPLIILGRIEERRPIKSDGSFELKISVTKFLNGQANFDQVTATEIRGPSSPLVIRRTYELHKEYVFPIKLQKGKKKPIVYLQPDGCPDLVIADKSI